MGTLDPGVSSALVAFSAALLTLFTAVCYSLTQQVKANKRDINAVGSKVNEVAGGGAMVPMRNVTLPVWDQLNDPLPDGSLPAQRFNECGEECVAEVIEWVHGVEIGADALRFLLRGPGGSAITDAWALAKQRRCHGIKA
jgi:hypothetical protein